MISIHALREEGDLTKLVFHLLHFLFLSTPSARRATRQLAGNNQAGLISIHALREEGDLRAVPLRLHGQISIHALREEGDCAHCTRSAAASISIHALREEGDCLRRGICLPRPISIHALREEGDADKGLISMYREKFLSTPSARRATQLRHRGDRQA